MFVPARNLSLLACLVSAVLLAGSVEAQKKPPKPSGPTPVTANFRCPLGEDCNGDRIQGDSVGPYVGSTTTQEGPYFNSTHDFVFPLQTGLGRAVFVDFSQPVGTPACAATKTNTCNKNFSTVVTDTMQPASMVNPVDALDTELPNGFLSISIGQSVNARFKLNFPDPGGRDLLWTIRFNPTMYPGSGYVVVTRTTATTWIIEATPSDPAELVSQTASPGKQVMTHEGFYTMPFKITVTS